MSGPIHRHVVSTNYPWLPHNVDPANNPTPDEYKGMPIQTLGNRKQAYDDMIKGCVIKYPRSKGLCQEYEYDRVEMNLRQPQNMQNYTDTGFKKIRTPPAVWKLLQDFWEHNSANYKRHEENWGRANTYVNHWDSPSYMISVENKGLRGGGYALKDAIWNAAKNTIEEWTGEEVKACSLYGIRVYTEGAVLASHVDRLPLVSSAIVNVAQDVDEPWPLEVYGRDGKAVNVTMEPGDMVLYESHSTIHGRPFPLKGRYYANVFIHFEPIGHTLRHNSKHGITDVDAQYKEAVSNKHGGHEHHDSGLPDYILREDSYEAKEWFREHEDYSKSAKAPGFQTGSTEAHELAKKGDSATLHKLLSEKKDLVHTQDKNGWTPLHEGARKGDLDVIKVLIAHGADVNALTSFEDDDDKQGETPLYWATRELGVDNPVVTFLESIGASLIGPEL